MLDCYVTQCDTLATPILLIPQKTSNDWVSKQNEFTKNWLAASNARFEPGASFIIPNSDGKVSRVVCCIADEKDFWSVGNLSVSLPAGTYRFEPIADEYRFAMVWGLGAYQFSRYKKSTKTIAKLYLPDAKIAENVLNVVASTYWIRDLINTPTDHMGPTELAHEATLLAKDYGAKLTQIVGSDLLKNRLAAIHAVGRASDDAPRLIDMRWGSKGHPKVTLVGKGVCFDTGGLDIKPASGMALMKKDMAGAAHVLGLARMIMHDKLPIQLRVLIPAVENSISGNSYRPGDVFTNRKGLTVEIGNTDAEGRLVVGDALALACEEKPDLLIDLTTLTGAARIALGPEIAALFSNADDVVTQLTHHAQEEFDPLWRMPLWRPYREYLNSPIADINNASAAPYGGAITAALYLKECINDDIPWLHFDIMAWNDKSKPGRPQGGEANGLRALFAYLKKRFGK